MNKILILLLPLFAAGCAATAGNSAFDVAPVPIFQSRPIYPKYMADRSIQGKTIIDFFVETDGSVQEADAIQYTNPQFEAAALDCVRQWRFRPALKDGVPVRAEIRVPIIFDSN